ncbi:MAG: hypothetical protein F6J93_07430 [Oscillatoria sp. SIO1A7]|nr:hypothetical protein [Oscillatoria sp. SIO1A7]
MTSYRLSNEGKVEIKQAQAKSRWTREFWSSKAYVSVSTLRRFLSGNPVSSENFIALCEAIGIEDWQSLVDWESSGIEAPSTSQARRSSFIVSGTFDDDKRMEIEALLKHLKTLLGSCNITVHSEDNAFAPAPEPETEEQESLPPSDAA